jgi:DNA-binding transcriptional LysR family regulator
VELRHLRYFVAVATELHFGRAAERLLISQPALSQQIRTLEGELGLHLLDRNRRGVQLTPEGEAFLAEAKAVVQQADRALDVVRALAEGATGHLRLSYVRTIPGGLPEAIVREYQRRYPGVVIAPDSGSTGQNVERLSRGDLDVAFVHPPFETDVALTSFEIATEALVVAIPSAHPLTKRRRLRCQDLIGVPLVYFPRQSSPGVYDGSLSQVYGSTPPDIVRTEPTEERILVAVAEGVGISLFIEERAAMLRQPGVVYRRFAHPEPTVALAVAFHEPASLPVRRFTDLARELGQQPRPAKRSRL